MVDGFPSFAPELSQENEGFPTDGFDRLSRLEAGNFWFRSRSALIVWALRRYFPSMKNFFEIGCGNGYVLSCVRKAFPGVQFSGSEIYQRGLHYTGQRVPGADLFQMDARKIPFQDHFDLIGAFDVLEHIPEDEIVLKRIFEAVKPAGGLLITVPQHQFLWTYADDYTGHVRRYSASELRAKVEKAGFKVITVTSFVSFLFPLLVLSRRFQGNDPKKYDPEAEFRISPFLNGALEVVMNVERLFIRAGFRFLWGGSLLLVAQKA